MSRYVTSRQFLLAPSMFRIQLTLWNDWMDKYLHKGLFGIFDQYIFPHGNQEGLPKNKIGSSECGPTFKLIKIVWHPIWDCIGFLINNRITISFSRLQFLRSHFLFWDFPDSGNLIPFEFYIKFKLDEFKCRESLRSSICQVCVFCWAIFEETSPRLFSRSLEGFKESETWNKRVGGVP